MQKLAIYYIIQFYYCETIKIILYIHKYIYNYFVLILSHRNSFYSGSPTYDIYDMELLDLYTSN